MAKKRKDKDSQPAAPPDQSVRLRLNRATAARDRIAAKAPETISSATKYQRLCAQVVRLRYLLEMQ